MGGCCSAMKSSHKSVSKDKQPQSKNNTLTRNCDKVKPDKKAEANGKIGKKDDKAEDVLQQECNGPAGDVKLVNPFEGDVAAANGPVSEVENVAEEKIETQDASLNSEDIIAKATEIVEEALKKSLHEECLNALTSNEEVVVKNDSSEVKVIEVVRAAVAVETSVENKETVEEKKVSEAEVETFMKDSQLATVEETSAPVVEETSSPVIEEISAPVEASVVPEVVVSEESQVLAAEISEVTEQEKEQYETVSEDVEVESVEKKSEEVHVISEPETVEVVGQVDEVKEVTSVEVVSEEPVVEKVSELLEESQVSEDKPLECNDVVENAEPQKEESVEEPVISNEVSKSKPVESAPQEHMPVEVEEIVPEPMMCVVEESNLGETIQLDIAPQHEEQASTEQSVVSDESNVEVALDNTNLKNSEVCEKLHEIENHVEEPKVTVTSEIEFITTEQNPQVDAETVEQLEETGVVEVPVSGETTSEEVEIPEEVKTENVAVEQVVQSLEIKVDGSNRTEEISDEEVEQLSSQLVQNTLETVLTELNKSAQESSHEEVEAPKVSGDKSTTEIVTLPEEVSVSPGQEIVEVSQEVVEVSQEVVEVPKEVVEAVEEVRQNEVDDVESLPPPPAPEELMFPQQSENSMPSSQDSLSLPSPPGDLKCETTDEVKVEDVKQAPLPVKEEEIACECPTEEVDASLNVETPAVSHEVEEKKG